MIIHHQDNIAGFAGAHTLYWLGQPLTYQGIGSASGDVVMIAESGAFVMTGYDADLIESLVITMVAEAGTFVMTGYDADLIPPLVVTLVAESGSFIMTGYDATLRAPVNWTDLPATPDNIWVDLAATPANPWVDA